MADNVNENMFVFFLLKPSKLLWILFLMQLQTKIILSVAVQEPCAKIVCEVI